MSGGTQLHIVRRVDLPDAKLPDGWSDPEKLAPLSPQKIEALRDFPLPVEDQEPIQIIGAKDQQVIGRMDLIPGVLEIGGKRVRIYWGSELAVPAAHRNTLMGVMLIMKSHALHHTLGALGPSQMALPVYTKLGWTDLPIPRYVMIRRSRSVVERYFNGGVKSAVITSVADAMLAAHRCGVALYRLLKTRGLVAIPADGMDPSFDDLLSKPRAPITAHRSAAWINWQLNHSFRTDPRDKKNFFYVRNRRGETLGYFVNKVRFFETATHRGFKNVLLGTPVDWMSFDHHAVETKDLLLLAIAQLFQSHVDAIELCTPDPRLRMMLRLLGFIPVGNMHLCVRARSPSPLTDESLKDVDNWWIRPGDGDVSLF